MRRKYRSLTASVTHPRHLEAGNKVIKMLNTLLLTFLAGTAGFVCFLLCLKPWQAHQETEEKLIITQKAWEKAYLLKEQREKELEWLITDPRYFQLIVRDKLDMANEGEAIIRIDRVKPEETSSSLNPESGALEQAAPRAEGN